ncbi:MAG TPA: molybdopterin-dependent oxidoreductase [Ktedonobacteraceae bacterium]|nr:molybdopterin-dependent oxidoreductase [Ktedonobacteraceae bacterium]
MQKTGQTTPEIVQSPPARLSRVKRVLIAGLLSLIAGLVASLMAVFLMLVLRLTAGIPTPVELFGDYVLKHISVNTFLKLLLTFKSNAKTAPLGLALLGMIGLGTVLGLVYAALVRVAPPVKGYRPGRREWLVAGIFAVVMALTAIVLFWNEIRQNFLGLPINPAIVVAAVGLLADFVLYGATLAVAYRVMLPKQRVTGVAVASQGRRQLLARAGVAVVGVGAAAGTFGLVKDFLNSYSGYDGMETFTQNGFTAPITTNSDHYVVTQNPIDPAVNTAVWRLEVTGLVGNSGSYTYSEIQNLPSTSRAITLECIANGPGGHLMSTAIWQGVTLSSLLALHGGAQPSASYVAFYSVDGYNMSLPLSEVLADDALLAWRMNGVELPQRHGFPMRVLIPGHYGEENPKWLTRVELTDHFVGGLYSDQGWYNGPLRTTSRIDRPTGRVRSGQTVEVGGVAFAGNRGIEKVEVSTDAGLTWNTATLQPALSQDSWVLWTWQWQPTTPGQYTLAVRATDGTGAVQTSQKQGTVPNGSTGYHEVSVQVI